MENQKIKIEDLVGKTIYFPYYNVNNIYGTKKSHYKCEKMVVEEYYKTNDYLLEQKEFNIKYNQLVRDYIKRTEKFKDRVGFHSMRNLFNNRYNSPFGYNNIYLPHVELESDDTYNIINISETPPQPISNIISMSEFNERWFLDEELAIKCMEKQKNKNKFDYLKRKEEED